MPANDGRIHPLLSNRPATQRAPFVVYAVNWAWKVSRGIGFGETTTRRARFRVGVGVAGAGCDVVAGSTRKRTFTVRVNRLLLHETLAVPPCAVLISCQDQMATP